MKKIKAVIFDMDGIIVDSEPWQMIAMRHAVAPFNITLTDEELSEFIGIRTTESFLVLKERHNIPISVEELTEIKDKHYKKILMQEIQPRENLLDLIKYLNNKYRLALASSSTEEEVDNILHLLNLIKYFAVIVTGDDVTNGKPDPEIFLKTADKLKIPCEDCAVIEDSRNGINAARKTGMMSIAVPTKDTLAHDFSNADYVFGDLIEIKKIL